MKSKVYLFLAGLAFLVPYLLIYRAFFTNSPLSWGDAPFFYPENLKELFNFPFTWDIRNDNFGAPQFNVLWLYLPTYLYGLVNDFLGIENNILVRIIFYLPATLISFLGAWFLIGSFVKDKQSLPIHHVQGKQSLPPPVGGGKIPKFLGSFFYSFNTYFLMVADGGQIGVALAYGLFPLTAHFLYQYLHLETKKYFFLSLLFLLLLTNIDMRIFLLLLLTVFLILIGDLDKLKVNLSSKLFGVAVLLISTFLADLFWILPTWLNFNSVGLNIGVDKLEGIVSLTNSLFIYQPQFPLNEFGRSINVPFYFAFVPLLLFGGLLARKKQFLIFGLIFLVLAFITKGSSEPLGLWYTFLVNNIPLGFLFRDSSKFFIPQILFASLLLSFSVCQIALKLPKKKNIFFVFVYIFLLILISPAFGGLTGTLSLKPSDPSFSTIAGNLKASEPFFRSVWFPEKPPLGYAVWGKEAISANNLYKDLPFALMIQGEYDLFYFLHHSQLSDWFKLLGIKYAFFPENPRKKTWTDQERKDREKFVDFLSQNTSFKVLNWPISFPGYQVSDPNPKIFTQEKVIIVVGDGSIYENLKTKYTNFHLYNQGFIFVEDGLFNPDQLVSLPKQSAYLILNQRNNIDLALALKQRNFLEFVPSFNNWGVYKSNQYLNWKYELLKNGIAVKDLGFNRGLYFSSIKDEKLQFKIPVPQNGQYRLALRTISNQESAGIRINFKNQEILKNIDSFKWNVLGPLSLQKGNENISLENLGGFNAVNVIALIPEQDYQEALSLSNQIIEKYEHINLDTQIEKKLKDLQYQEVGYQMHNPTNYLISLNEGNKWIIFTDHYNRDWNINNTPHFPLYSMINGFYVDQPQSLQLQYLPQSSVKFSVYLSMATVLVIIVGGLVYFLRRKIYGIN
ncbi:MAG: hypothetical protein HYW45_00370 [Candidatus Daviesbacteria bacterium]|nr:MAG: hypothetical protein HYW45_00370 [Candidatus Daviesbacteria bacterium]